MKTGQQIQFTLPVATILLNKWKGMHWAKQMKHRQEMALLVREALQSESDRPAVPFKHCKIEVDRYSSGLADWDGVVGGLKALLDCLVVQTKRNPSGLGVIQDDNPNCVIECPLVRQHKAPPKKGWTVVTITEIIMEA